MKMQKYVYFNKKLLGEGIHITKNEFFHLKLEGQKLAAVVGTVLY